LRNDWKNYIGALEESHVIISEHEDELIWTISQCGQYTPKEGYSFIVSKHEPDVAEWWWKPL